MKSLVLAVFLITTFVTASSSLERSGDHVTYSGHGGFSLGLANSTKSKKMKNDEDLLRSQFRSKSKTSGTVINQT